MTLTRLLSVLCIAGALVLHSRAATLTVFAAGYEKQTGDKVRFNFAASSFLARRIEEGAPADIFFSAGFIVRP